LSAQANLDTHVNLKKHPTLNILHGSMAMKLQRKIKRETNALFIFAFKKRF
jgi:hypothetical protein